MNKHPDYPPTRYDVDRWFPDNGIPAEAIIHYAESHGGYSWGESLIVYEIDGKFFTLTDYEDCGHKGGGTYEVSAEEALEAMMEFEEGYVGEL